MSKLSYNFKTSEYVSTEPEDYTEAEDALAAAEHFISVGRLIDARRLELRGQKLQKGGE